MKLLTELEGDKAKDFASKAQLKMFLAWSAPVNPKYNGAKGGPGINIDKLPDKAKRDEEGKISDVGGAPSMPFTRTCKDGDKQCIAQNANAAVQNYFGRVKLRLAPPPSRLPDKSPTSNAKRKRAQKKVFDPKRNLWTADRPAGSATMKGDKVRWADRRERTPVQAAPSPDIAMDEVPLSKMAKQKKVKSGLQLSPEMMAKSLSAAGSGVLGKKTPSKTNVKVPGATPDPKRPKGQI